MVKEITVEYGFTKNFGNYESERLTVSATVTLQKDENVDKEMEFWHDHLEGFVHEKLGLIKKDYVDEISEVLSPPVRRRRI